VTNARAALPRLWAIHTEPSPLAARALAERLLELDAPFGWGLQLRHKRESARAQLDRCRSVAALGVRVSVNGRPDIARAGGLSAVHLPARGLPTALTRELLGGVGLVGRSTHRSEEVEQAMAEGADYVFFGPVYATSSKPAVEPVGLTALRRACAVGVPVYALGGVDLERLPEVAAQGAYGAAAIGLFTDLPSAADWSVAFREVPAWHTHESRPLVRVEAVR
jgi:thiamine-phosphate diphosphorylase